MRILIAAVVLAMLAMSASAEDAKPAEVTREHADRLLAQHQAVERAALVAELAKVKRDLEQAQFAIAIRDAALAQSGWLETHDLELQDAGPGRYTFKPKPKKFAPPSADKR